MKKLILLLAAVALATSVWAQDTPKKPSFAGFVSNGFWDNWEITLGGGAGTALSNGTNQGSFGDRINFEANFGLTKWFHPVTGMRLQLQGGRFANFDDVLGKAKWPYLFVHADFMLNFSNWAGGYREDRAYYAVPFAGFGYMASNFTDKSHENNGSGTHQSFAFTLGWLNKFRISPSFDFNIELKGLIAPSRVSPVAMDGSYLFGFSATAGFTYRFNKRGWQRGVAGYTVADIQAFQDAVAASMAAAAAKEIMDKGPYSLVTGDVKTAYRSLFTSAGLLTQEVIFGREYSKELSAFHETSWYYYSPTYGAKIAMTKKFMNTYLTTRGTPFTDIDGYQTIDFIREFDGRDARMAQTVISPTYKMKISGRERLYSPNWKVTRTGYHPIKWSIDDDADNVLSKAASWNSLPILRYAEVLLNYAEAKAELGEMDAAVWDQTIAQLRSRAGVTPVVPDKADPYMEAYFLNTVTDKWILEVRRERGIELCLEMGLRWDDDMRWHMGDLLTSDNNPWTGIWIGNTGYTYDFTGQSTDDNGDPVPDFYIRPGEDTEHSIAISNTGANQTFSLNAAGNIVWEYKRTWGEKKYLRPIPQTAITRNPNLEQNALWK